MIFTHKLALVRLDGKLCVNQSQPKQCHNNVNLLTPETKLDSVIHWGRNQALS